MKNGEEEVCMLNFFFCLMAVLSLHSCAFMPGRQWRDGNMVAMCLSFWSAVPCISVVTSCPYCLQLVFSGCLSCNMRTCEK